MIIEMHCHTAEHSACSHVNAAELVQHNFNIDLQGTVITDHHYLWPQEEIDELRRKLKVPDYYLILSGQEVATPELGDVLIYGADVSIEKDSKAFSRGGYYLGPSLPRPAHPIPRQIILSAHRWCRDIQLEPYGG